MSTVNIEKIKYAFCLVLFYGVFINMNVIGFIVGLILLLGVGIPVSTQVIDEANLSGISATVVAFIPVFLAVGALVAEFLNERSKMQNRTNGRTRLNKLSNNFRGDLDVFLDLPFFLTRSVQIE